MCVSCPLYPGWNEHTTINENQPDIETKIPKQSGFWLIDHIEIDQNNPLLTWEVINQTYEWCTGNGTIDDPFIIENVSINAINYEIGISIIGSKGIHFFIQNSQISNASTGIKLDTTDDGAIINNSISNNIETGILIHNCKRNEIVGNIIQNNSQYGILLNGPNSKSNNFYRNKFIENGKHALDNSKTNFNTWYNSSVGNYWDNYTGKDANDDGIGDTPYDYIYGSANSQDIYPTWWDPPSLSISYPLNNTSYGKFAADFKLIIEEGKGDTFWYEIASKNSSFLSLLGVIDEEIIDVFEQDLWDNLSNGTHRIRFYVNDSKGYLGIKDVVINAIIPTLNNWWNSSYAYRVPLKLVNKHSNDLPEGYSVNVSINTVNLYSTGKIRVDGEDLRIVWYNATSNVWVELDRVNETNFNAIDTRLWFKTQTPVSPNTYDGCYYLYYGCSDCNEPPTNSSKIYDFFDDFSQDDGPANGWTVINGSWSVDSGVYIENLLEVDGRSLLNSYTIENASIEVRVNSSAGNFGAGVMFRHLDNHNFYTAGIGFWEYEVAIGKWTDDNPSQLENTSTYEDVLNAGQWYDLKIDVLGSSYLVYLDGILKNNLTDTDHLNAGQIGLMTWTNLSTSYFDDLKIRLLIPNEPLIFLGIEETFIPQINNIFESADPLELGNSLMITVNVTDPSGINQVLIEFDGISYTMIHIGGDLWQNDSWIPLSTGDYNYTIYCQSNNLKWNSINGSIQVIDTTLPIFSNLIESSDPLELGSTEVITIDIFDLSGINQVFILIKGKNYSMTNIGETTWQYDNWIPQTIGSKPYTIYAEDNNNNLNYTTDSITVTDFLAPTILINSPSEGQYFGVSSPSFNVEIFDLSLNKTWYTLNLEITKHFFTENGSVDQLAWNDLLEGSITITFYANDSAANEHSESVQVFRDITNPSTPSLLSVNPATWTNIDNFNLSWSNPADASGIVGAYYKLDAIPTTDTDGTYVAGINIQSIIDITVGTDGIHDVYVWLVDAVGNTDYNNYASIQLYLDTLGPIAPILLTADPVSWTNIDSFNLSWTNPAEFSGIVGAYYKLDSAPTSDMDGTYVSGTDIQSLIDITVGSDGVHNVYVWLVDAAGNGNYNNYAFTQLFLDSLQPEAPISLTADPASWTNVNSFNLSWMNPIDASEIVGAYYKLDSLPTSNSDGIYVSGADIQSLIDITVGSDGVHNIYVWLVDAAGNVDHSNYAFTQLSLDTVNPSIIDNQLGDDTWRNSTGTTYDVDFSDLTPSSNLDTAQYKITTLPGQGGIVVIDWTNIFTNLGATSFTTDWEIDFNVCQEGINYISVRVYDVAGNFETFNDVFYVNKDTVVPIAPISLTADPATWTNIDSFNLSWSNPTDTSEIVGVYYKLDSAPTSDMDGTYVSGINIQSLIDISIGSDGVHNVYVWLVDAAGNVNYNNYAFTQLSLDTLQPEAPISLTADPISWINVDSFNLSWSNPTDVSEIVGAYYKLDSAPTSNSDGTYVSGINIQSLIDITVGSDGVHNVYVWLVDAAGNVDYSNYAFTQLFLDTLQPEAPISLTADPASWTNVNSFNLSWTNPAELSGIVGVYYKLDSTPTSDMDGTYVSWMDIQSLIDITVGSDGVHNVYIWLVDAAGNVDYSNYASTQLSLDTLQPEAPISLTADPPSWTNVNSFNLSWSNPMDVSEIVGAYYKLGSAPTSDMDGTYVSGMDIQSLIDITVGSDGVHNVYVWLVDAAGNVDYSNYA
ncbi:MAG: NosD domain-containing protein, partial [Promethearchaeota archaeon]